MIRNVIVTVGLIASQIGIGKRSKGSRHNGVDYNSLKVQFRTIYTVELECILEGGFALRMLLIRRSLLRNAAVRQSVYHVLDRKYKMEASRNFMFGGKYAFRSLS